MDGVNFPFAKATLLTPTVAAGAAAVTLSDNFTYVDLGELAANTTLTITASSETRVGAMVLVKALSDGTARSLTFAGDAKAIAISGTISKTKTKLLVYDGADFVGINEQID